MAAAYRQDFLCSICLEVLTDPVSTPCGHNFCELCINRHWNTSTFSTFSKCPMCNQLFVIKPQLKVNTMMREMLSNFRRESELKAGDDILQQMIQKMVQLRESAKNMKSATERRKAEVVEMFTGLKELVERSLDELMENMEEQQEAEEREAEGLIKELEEEIIELMKRSFQRKQLSRYEDILQHSLKAPPSSKNWSEVLIRPSSYEWTVLRAVDQLEDTLRHKMMKMKMEMKRLPQFHLVVSDDGKLVFYRNVRKKLPDNKERFVEK